MSSCGPPVGTHGFSVGADPGMLGGVPVLDVHAHFVPPDLPDMGARAGGSGWPKLITGPEPEIVQDGSRYRAVHPGYYDPDVRIAQLDDLGIQVQVLSPLPVMLPVRQDAAAARDLCAAYNERLVAVRDRHPSRFRAFGMLPLQSPRLAVEEVERARALGMDGLELGTYVGGEVELADEPMEDVFRAAAEAELPILLHPNHGDTFDCRDPVVELGVGVGCEMARAMALLHLSGTLDRVPGLRVCLAHGGGAFLWLWPRFRALAERAGASASLSEPLHVDTAGLVEANLDLLATLLPPDRVLFGSDLPAAAPDRVSALLDALPTGSPVRFDNVAAFLGARDL